MQKVSAGLLMYKIRNNQLEFFLAHSGGPFWKNKDEGAWGIPKGELNDKEEPLNAAKREFWEETGITAKEPFIPLKDITQKSGKIVHCWAFEGDWTGLLLGDSYVTMEHPKGSKKIIKFPEIRSYTMRGLRNRIITFPEVDKAGFFTLEKAKKMINPAQFELLLRLKEHLEKTK